MRSAARAVISLNDNLPELRRAGLFCSAHHLRNYLRRLLLRR